MSPPTRRRLALEALAVTLGATAAWAVIYGPWIDSCCGVFDEAVLFVLLASAFIGGLLTGTTSDPGRAAVLVGFIVEALVAWAIVRLAMRYLNRKVKVP